MSDISDSPPDGDRGARYRPPPPQRDIGRRYDVARRKSGSQRDPVIIVDRSGGFTGQMHAVQVPLSSLSERERARLFTALAMQPPASERDPTMFGADMFTFSIQMPSGARFTSDINGVRNPALQDVVAEYVQREYGNV